MQQTVFEIKSTQILRETAQALQEGRKMARSIENICTSMRPLAAGDTSARLDQIEEHAMAIARELQNLYNRIAKDAFGSEDGR